jgi:hypothetical protein
MVRLVTQLTGAGTASYDGGPATTAMAADRASAGRLRPSIRVVRTKMGVSRGPTDPRDWKRALDGFERAMARKGLRPVPNRLVIGGELSHGAWPPLVAVVAHPGRGGERQGRRRTAYLPGT